MKRKIKRLFLKIYDKILYKLAVNCEKRKFKDKRRVEIYSKIHLSKQQKKQIDDLYITNYGKKIPYIWHQHYTAFTGNFDSTYFPELLFIPEFERYKNNNKSYAKVFADKNVIPLIAKSVGVKTPKTIISCANGIYRDENYNIINYQKVLTILNDIGVAFIKPTVDTCSGINCQSVVINNGIDEKTNKRITEIIEKLGSNFVVQENIRCHASIVKLYPNSVNTFRVITYVWNERIECMPIIMRIGQGGNDIDNAHAGGMFIAVDNDGTLHEKAFTEFNVSFAYHPNTKVKFEGYKIQGVEGVIETAKKMHAAIPQLGVVNWDFTINDRGESVLIEANTLGGSIWLIQMAHGTGGFGKNTESILKWLKEQKT